MATVAAGNGGGASSAVAKSAVKSEDWLDVVPPNQDAESAMSKTDSDKVWAALYLVAGVQSEKEQRSLRLAVYAYGAKNGTSREGAYRQLVKLAGGRSFAAAEIPRATGKFEIRRFFRANMNEAYDALKVTKLMEKDQEYVSLWEKRGVARHLCFACADYLNLCSKFTPEEERASQLAFGFGIRKAAGARGESLEKVESQRVDEQLAVQGAHVAPPSSESW